MKSKTQKYFDAMQSKYDETNVKSNKTDTTSIYSHNMTMRKHRNSSLHFPSFEEKVYLENDALAKFNEFLEKE